MKHILISSLGLLGAVLSSCTGDPTRGGIFWSPSQAQERQQNLIQQQREKQAELESLQRLNQQLKQQKNQLR